MSIIKLKSVQVLQNGRVVFFNTAIVSFNTVNFLENSLKKFNKTTTHLKLDSKNDSRYKNKYLL